MLSYRCIAGLSSPGQGLAHTLHTRVYPVYELPCIHGYVHMRIQACVQGIYAIHAIPGIAVYTLHTHVGCIPGIQGLSSPGQGLSCT
jgi:hypothetical protein